jgi:hypothetical protein
MSDFSVGTVESSESGQLKFFVQTGWRPYESEFHPNEGLKMLGDPQVFEATPENLEKVLYRYQKVDIAACADLTHEIVQAYITAREHNGYQSALTGSSESSDVRDHSILIG